LAPSALPLRPIAIGSMRHDRDPMAAIESIESMEGTKDRSMVPI
jgi:hypothetical protein